MAFCSKNYLLILGIITIIVPLCQSRPPSKIVGGTRASITEWPSMVSLRLYDQHRCGGSLISKCHVLTAAHCVFETDWRMMKVATGSAAQDGFRNFYEIKNVDIHPKYVGEPNMHGDDVALITLAKCIVENPTQKATGLYKSSVGNSVHGIVIGWGQLFDELHLTAKFLQKIDSWTIPNNDCAKYYGLGVIRPSHLCTISHPGKGFCSGDSGGPFYVNGQVAGIVSMGAKCGSGIPDIYTRVYNYIPWIEKIMQKK